MHLIQRQRRASPKINRQPKPLDLPVPQKVLAQAAVSSTFVEPPKLRILFSTFPVLFADFLNVSLKIRVIVGDEGQTLLLLLVERELEEKPGHGHEPLGAVLGVPGEKDILAAEPQCSNASGPHLKATDFVGHLANHEFDALPVAVVDAVPHGQDVYVVVGRVLLGVVELVGPGHQVTPH